MTNLTEALGDRFPAGARIVSIGPVTSETARAAGLEVDVEAERHDIDGLLEALLKTPRSDRVRHLCDAWATKDAHAR